MAPSTLSESQQQVYDLLAKGYSPEKIADTLNSTLGVINAQITRIKTKGGSIPSSPMNVNLEETFAPQPQVQKPQSTGASSNDEIANMLNTSGKAISAEELRELAAKAGGHVARDIHPMVLLGVTIQFVKLCGGRIIAHQVIEEVYAALAAMFGKPDTTAQEPPHPPQGEQERIKYLEERVQAMANELQKLRS